MAFLLQKIWIFVLLWLVLFLTTNGAIEPRCRGAFDIYFILDKSSSVPIYNFQQQTVNFVENITNSFISPQLRISFITFSDADASEIILGLTSDRTRIAEGLENLRQVRPKGVTYMATALKKVTEQIETMGQQAASFLLIVTDGALNDLVESVSWANRARALGAWVLTVGVAAFEKYQLQQLANKPSSDFVFTEVNFDSLKNLIDVIVEKSCIEIVSATPTEVCTAVPFTVTLEGRGFNKTDDITHVICSFSFNRTYREVKKPISVTPTRLVCPGVMLNTTDRTAVLQVSMNNGQTFVSSNVTLSAISCDEATKVKREVERSNPGVAVFLVLFLLFLLLLAL